MFLDGRHASSLPASIPLTCTNSSRGHKCLTFRKPLVSPRSRFLPPSQLQSHLISIIRRPDARLPGDDRSGQISSLNKREGKAETLAANGRTVHQTG